MLLTHVLELRTTVQDYYMGGGNSFSNFPSLIWFLQKTSSPQGRSLLLTQGQEITALGGIILQEIEKKEMEKHNKKKKRKRKEWKEKEKRNKKETEKKRKKEKLYK